MIIRIQNVFLNFIFLQHHLHQLRRKEANFQNNLNNVLLVVSKDGDWVKSLAEVNNFIMCETIDEMALTCMRENIGYSRRG